MVANIKYSFIQITEETIPILIPIFKKSFGWAPSLESIIRKHRTDFTGIRNLGVIAYDESNEAVGFYGIYPAKLRINGDNYIAAQSGDTMVIPIHRRKAGGKLFMTMATKVYELAKQHNVIGVFGFPSPASYPGFIKRLNWIHRENLLRFRFICPTIPISEMARRLPLIRKALMVWQGFLVKIFKQGYPFTGSIQDEGFDCVVRDSDYWMHKTSGPGVYLIKICNVDLVVKIDGGLGVGDINTTDPKIIKKIIKLLKIYCFFSGICTINLYMSPKSPLALALTSIQEPKIGLPIGYCSFRDESSLEKVVFSYMDIDTF